MRDFKSYECEGQMELLDYLQHDSFSCQREEADTNEAEELKKAIFLSVVIPWEKNFSNTELRPKNRWKDCKLR